MRGIAVIQDVVHNHYGPSDLEMWQFDGWQQNNKGGIYFYQDYRSSTPWGDTRPDYGRNEVRTYIRDSVMTWLQEYRADGLRWDSTVNIRNTNNGMGTDIPDGWSLMSTAITRLMAKIPSPRICRTTTTSPRPRARAARALTASGMHSLFTRSAMR